MNKEELKEIIGIIAFLILFVGALMGNFGFVLILCLWVAKEDNDKREEERLKETKKMIEDAIRNKNNK